MNIADLIIEDYFINFKQGNTYSYFFDKIRYIEPDSWISKHKWIDIATSAFKADNHHLQALEILMSENPKEYYAIADEILGQWYSGGAYDLGYYLELLLLMPKNYYIRKAVFDDYSEFLSNYSTSTDSMIREILIRNNDVDFLKQYGNFLNNQIDQNRTNRKKILEMLDNNCIIDLGKDKLAQYVEEKNISLVRDIVWMALKQDKKNALKLLNDDISEEEQKLFILDIAPKIAFYLGWDDIFEFLKNEDWYWALVFDEIYGYEINNQHLLIWSYYISNPIIESRAKELMKLDFLNQVDGAIALKRISQKTKSDW